MNRRTFGKQLAALFASLLCIGKLLPKVTPFHIEPNYVMGTNNGNWYNGEIG